MQFTDQMHQEDAKEDNMHKEDSMHKEERMMRRNAAQLRHGKARGFLGRVWRALRDSRGLINTTDLLVAAGATVILAAGVGAASIDNLNQAKYGKAQPDAVSLATAVTSFYKDTGKWPGQADHPNVGNSNSISPLFLVSTSNDSLPSSVNGALEVTAASCANNSLDGFVGSSITADALATATKKNLNEFLVRKPSNADTDYPNWKGPYIQAEIKTDPWDKSWVLNLMPLYCSETTTAATSGLGYAWILSGGTNRAVSTLFTAAFLDPDGDDAGISLGKLTTRGKGGAD